MLFKALPYAYPIIPSIFPHPTEAFLSKRFKRPWCSFYRWGFEPAYFAQVIQLSWGLWQLSGPLSSRPSSKLLFMQLCLACPKPRRHLAKWKKSALTLPFPQTGWGCNHFQSYLTLLSSWSLPDALMQAPQGCRGRSPLALASRSRSRREKYLHIRMGWNQEQSSKFLQKDRLEFYEA